MITAGLIAQQQLLIPLGGGGTLWTPLNMATVPQIYINAQESIVTDASGFASAISNLGSLGANGAFSQATADRRPQIINADVNGKRILRFDNDFMTCAAGSRNLFQSANAAWSFAVYKKRTTDTADTPRFLLQALDNIGATRFGHAAGWLAGAANKPTLSVRRLDGGTTNTMSGVTASSGVYVMSLAAVNVQSRLGRIYIDGVVDADNATLVSSAGAFSGTLASGDHTLGARNDGAFAADVDLLALVLGNVYPSNSDIDKLFGWAAHYAALTASLPSGHPYKTSPPMA